MAGPQLYARAAQSCEPAAAAALVDADWRFGVTTATDDVARVGSTFVQLRLTLLDGGSVRDEHMELTLAQFYDLLAQLERARSYTDYLSSPSPSSA